jgi:hypothetical protein
MSSRGTGWPLVRRRSMSASFSRFFRVLVENNDRHDREHQQHAEPRHHSDEAPLRRHHRQRRHLPKRQRCGAEAYHQRAGA